MKKYTIIGLIVILLYLSVSSLFMIVTSAPQSQVSITNVNAILLESRTVGNREIRTYKIIALLHNSGSTPSERFSVKFRDPEFNATITPPIILSPSNISLQPGESKMFNLSEWPTPLTGDVVLNISFSPTSVNVPVNQYNSGYYLYTLHIGPSGKKTSTPGFEVAVLLIAIAVFVFLKKRNK